MKKLRALKLTRSSGLGSVALRMENSGKPIRKLIKTKFVNEGTLAIVFAISLSAFLYFMREMRPLPVYLQALMAAPLFFLILHKVYEIWCDAKLLFVQNRDYDKLADAPAKGRLPAITFIIPSYHEPFAVAKMTFDSVVNTPYAGRKEILVVDNSGNTDTDDFFQWKAYVENFGLLYPNRNITAKFLYNNVRATLKPGNLDLAQQHITEGELVVFLDIDSTLPEQGDLLERAVTQFKEDPSLGFIQFRIHSTNGHFNKLTRAVTASQDLLRLRQIMRGYGGYKIFEGHNGIWRKSVLHEIGDWTQYYNGDIIVTEDILKTADMYAKGYYGKSINAGTGEWVPASLKALEGMWMRWMYGNSQVFFKCFKKIYAGSVSFVEKFDITYHILHHVATVLFFLIAIVYQLLLPGHLANTFILAFYIAPQLLSMGVSWSLTDKQTDRRTVWRKLGDIYAGLFFIDTFIMYTQVKSDLKFVLGVPQGWKVTEKGLEDCMSWTNILRNKLFHLSLIAITAAVCLTSWIITYDMQWSAWSYYAASLFLNLNLLLCILVFAKDGRKEHNSVQSEIVPDLECLYETERIEVAVNS